MAWYEQEPYSTGPAIAASYLASLLDHYELVALVANKGLIANPHNPTLKLNQIFAWIAKSNLSELSAATLVEVEQAYRDLNDMVASNDWSISAHALANLGMLEYRLGDNERGRMRYEEAARIYEKNSPEFIILLLVNYLREALICDPDWAYEVMSRTKLALLGNSSSATPGGEYYLDKIFRLSSLPGTWRDKFRSESTRAMQAAQSPSTGVENRTLSVDAALSKFWLPKSFSRIESLSQFTDNADDSRKPPKC
jgi:tetratricopeptide (TPR) repeat protein